jgi:hypothetical protein
MLDVSPWREFRPDFELDGALLSVRVVAAAQCAKVGAVQVGPG